MMTWRVFQAFCSTASGASTRYDPAAIVDGVPLDRIDGVGSPFDAVFFASRDHIVRSDRGGLGERAVQWRGGTAAASRKFSWSRLP